MLFSCVRCAAPAAALMTFSYPDQAVWLVEIDSVDAHAPGIHLCTPHADRLTPPLGWTLTDRRNVTRLFTPSAPSEVA